MIKVLTVEEIPDQRSAAFPPNLQLFFERLVALEIAFNQLSEQLARLGPQVPAVVPVVVPSTPPGPAVAPVEAVTVPTVEVVSPAMPTPPVEAATKAGKKS